MFDATGGDLSVTAADGTRYTLTVPPGALATSTEITATPVLSMGAAPLADGLIGAVRFGPSGLQFALPATLRIEGVNPETSSGTTLIGFLRSNDGASMQLQAPLVVGNVIDLTLLHFSDAGVSEATPLERFEVPVDATAQPEAALADEYAREPLQTEAANAAALIRLHDTRVAPRLTLAESVTTPAERDVAVAVSRTWLGLVLASFGVGVGDANLPDGLGPVVIALRQRVLDLLIADFEAGRTACMAPAPVGFDQFLGLEAALLARQAVFTFSFIGGLPGLDADTAARRLNDCVRIVFVPQPRPTFAIGRPVSLDTRAQLLFAADPTRTFPAAFVFGVSSEDATVATPIGQADIDGFYTTVVTPTAADPLFAVEACMVVSLRGGGLVSTVMCGQQTVGGSPTEAVLAGRATRSLNRVDTAAEFTVSFQGAVDFSVRAEADGAFTVLEALGTITQVFSSNRSCRPDGVTSSSRVLTTRAVHSITRGEGFVSGLNTGFRFGGPTTRTTESFVNASLSCDITTTVNTIDDGDEFGDVLVTGIERDADGLPTTLTLTGSDGQTTGSLQRQ